MLQVEVKREYGDVLERVLYNVILASMSLDGKSYFYVNPLGVWPEASEKSPNRKHVKTAILQVPFRISVQERAGHERYEGRRRLQFPRLLYVPWRIQPEREGQSIHQ